MTFFNCIQIIAGNCPLSFHCYTNHPIVCILKLSSQNNLSFLACANTVILVVNISAYIPW